MQNKCIKARIRARVGGKARGSQALTPGEMVTREVGATGGQASRARDPPNVQRWEPRLGECPRARLHPGGTGMSPPPSLWFGRRYVVIEGSLTTCLPSFLGCEMKSFYRGERDPPNV